MARSQRRVEAFTHEQRTPNQPTEETRSSDDPVPTLTSPPSDRGPREPQLWWRSKEPENGWVQSAPRLYTQERIVPENYVMAMLKGGKPDEGDLFYDKFNGLDPQSAWEPYEHQARWANRLIRGESSQIMASLLEHEDMAGKVQMVYYDPPYGIGYDSNFQQLTGKPGARKGAQADVETVKAFRDRYHDGLHSYMDSLHRNLVLVRELLAEGGHCFIQMGSDNVHEVAMVAQHVFGKGNRMAWICYATTSQSTAGGIPDVMNHLLWFAKNKEEGLKRYNQLYGERTRKSLIETMGFMAKVEEADGTVRRLSKEEYEDPSKIPSEAKLCRGMPLTSMHHSPTRSTIFHYNGKDYEPAPSRATAQWRVSKDGLEYLAETNRLIEQGKTLEFKIYEDEMPGQLMSNLWRERQQASNKHYTVETSTETVERCMLMTTQPGDLVLDITCGSGTTALVAERWGRRWITTDTSAVPIALARQRIAAAIHPYQVLQDSDEGAQHERRLGGTPLPGPYTNDVRRGFVYQRSKKVTAAILAYDQEPETVLLVNQPEIDKTKLRPSSPFCVQNANATAYLPLSDRYDDVMPNHAGKESETQLTRERIEQALTRAGIKGSNGVAGKRITVENLKPYGQTKELNEKGEGYITHTADVTIPNGEESPQRAAIALVGFHRRVGESFVNLAIQEANGMRGVKILVVIGFEFEGATKRGKAKRGEVTVIKAQANTDLAIEDLQDAADDDAFVMLAEPELVITRTRDDRYEVQVKGVLTYDPEKGVPHRTGPEDIHCWMLDHKYDGQSFFARALHFLNHEDPQLKRLNRDLGALLDQRAWQRMVGDTSEPFQAEAGQIIAIKVVTTTGVELTAIRELD